jgi:NTE family protein
MFGAYQAGAYSAIFEQVRPDIVVGASVGALNGWPIASGCTPTQLIDQWLDPLAGETLRLLPTPGWRNGWFDPAPLRAQAQRICSAYTPRIPLGVVLVEFPWLRRTLFRYPEIQAEHLQATCSIPLFLPTVRINGRRYLDGGLLENIPVWAAIEMGARRIIAIDSLPRVKGKWWFHVGMGVASLVRPRRRYPAGVELTIIRPSEYMGDVNDAVFWKRSNIERWVDLGARDAARALGG